MQTLAIIADDLTGALDSAAPFAGQARVVVATSVDALQRALAEPHDVIAISTRSREIAAETAQDRVARVLSQLPEGTRLFKKIDSRLKGNIAGELRAFPDRHILAVPAIPDFGRIQRAGRLEGFGVDRPIDIAAALGGRAAEIPDVTTMDEMRDALRGTPEDSILVGARGLALALRDARGRDTPPPAPRLTGPLCLAVGSTDPITLAQVDALCARTPGLRVIEAPAGRLPCRGGAPADITLLQMTEGDNIPPARAARRFADGVGQWAEAAGTLVITGGASAEAVLDAMKIDVMSVAGEILPGLPCCRVAGQSIVTKSGGFGGADTFLRIAAMTTANEGAGHA